jgi:hypothetical protein
MVKEKLDEKSWTGLHRSEIKTDYLAKKSVFISQKIKV